MSREDRKKQAQKKIDKTVYEINDFFTVELKRTNNKMTAIDLTEIFVRDEIRRNPTETHIWTKAASIWEEEFIGLVKEYIKEKKLTKEQILYWRETLSMMIGPYAYIMPVEEIQKHRDKMQEQVNRIGEK